MMVMVMMMKLPTCNNGASSSPPLPSFITSSFSPPPPPPSAASSSFYSKRWPRSKRSAPMPSSSSSLSAVARSDRRLICMLDEPKNRGDGRVELAEEEGDRKSWDVSSTCVNPVYRSSTLLQTPSEPDENNRVRVLFTSEGNVCRSVYAEAIFRQLVEESGINDFVECSSKAIKDYNVGELPDYRAVEVAEVYGLNLPKGRVSQVIDCAKDIIDFDLVLVMDKFNASDLMKEVTVHEAVDKRTRYAHKVHRLGEFSSSRVIEDIDDPLYGNMGGPEEIELLHQVYHDIHDCCKGLVEVLLKIKPTLQDDETLKQGLSRYLYQMDALEWLAPPMLQNKK